MVTFKFSSMFDVNNEFDCAMIKVFMAREDLRKSVMLMNANVDDMHMLLFPFKVQVGYIKEVTTFLYTIFFENYMKKLQCFENHERILELKAQFEKQANKYHVFFNDIRNFSFHYKSTDDVKEVLCLDEYEDFVIEIIEGEKEIDVHYNFTDDIFLEMFCKYFYRDKFTFDMDESKITDMFKEVGVFGALIMNLLNEIISGFFASKTDQIEKKAE